MTGHKAWLDNEYQQWIAALQESTVDNFKEHPMVKRMIGDIDFVLPFNQSGEAFGVKWHLLNIINSIGYYEDTIERWDNGTLLRMIYYANILLELNPQSIVEIGAGVGQFYAVLRALGYKGDYYIFDLLEVRDFQDKYLSKVSELTGLDLSVNLNFTKQATVVSFYALGEFDDDTKDWYIQNVLNFCEHGFLIWNAHSGATNDKLKGIKHDIVIQPEQPLTSPGNLQITW